MEIERDEKEGNGVVKQRKGKRRGKREKGKRGKWKTKTVYSLTYL